MHFFSKILDTFAKDFIYFCYMDGDFGRYRDFSPTSPECSKQPLRTLEKGNGWQGAVDRVQQLIKGQDLYHAGELLEDLEVNADIPIIVLMDLWQRYFQAGMALHLGEAQEARYDVLEHPDVYSNAKDSAMAFYNASRPFGVEVRPEIIRQLNILP